MSKLAALSGGTGLTVGAGVVVAGAAAVAAYLSGAFAPEPISEQATAEPAALIAPAAEPVAQVEAKAKAPQFDVVRVETDGSAMIAGSAEAGSSVAITLDNEVVAEVKADSTGQFASFVSLPESKEPRVLTLKTEAGEASREQVIVAPVTVPVVEAETEPEQQQVANIAVTEPVEKVVPKTTPTQAEAEPREPAQKPTVLLATEEGVRVLQAPDAPQPEAMTSLLASISYDDAGEVALTGQGAGNFVRVYLDNRPIVTSQIAANGNWQAELPSVDTGIYTLRVDELDDAGKVVARVETPFKREDSEILAAAVQPEKPVQAITVQPGATLWAIARERYGSGMLYTRVVEANSDAIRNPDLIYPGQVFTVPE